MENQKRKIVIVGGVAGGATAAARLRRIDENAEIIMVERGPYISFANCGLPYHISGTIAERENLLVQTVEGFTDRFRVDVRVLSEAISVNREEKSITIKNLKTGEEYRESYDYLILSPGAAPLKPNLKGINSDRIFTLRNIPDLDKIMTALKEKEPKRAVVIGGGFIGIETAENLLERGIKVTLIEAANQILMPLDYEMAAMIHAHMKDKDIELYLGDGVSEFEDKEGYTLVYLKSGKRIKADIIILSIGVKPEIELAKNAGLKTDRGIVVDEYMQTEDKSIYAIGDAVEVKHYIGGGQTLIPLAWPANRQGRIVADNIIFGNSSKYSGTMGTSILKAFDLAAAATGLNERAAKMMGIEYETTITHGSSHASYYPGAMPLAVKMIYKKDGTILGAQAVGADGADKRIDVIATAIKGRLKVFELPELELAYAPPFGSAKDPVNIAGYVATNVLNGDMKIIHWDEIEKLDMEKTILLDVRTKLEFEMGTIKNALSIDLNTLRTNLSKLDKTKEIVVFCQVGLRGYLAYKILVQNGFNVRNLTGGYKTYSYAVAKQENPDIFDYEQIHQIIKEEKIVSENSAAVEAVKVNAIGLQCPGPLLATNKKAAELAEGALMEVSSSDLGYSKDVKAWCERTGNKLIDVKIEAGIVKATIQKGSGAREVAVACSPQGVKITPKDNKTIVVFSNDIDKVMASLIIANGAIAMGKKVTLFFTFWGLSVLRKQNAPKVKKGLLDKMFGMMLPKGVRGLNSISKMNMMGMGAQMIKKVMKDKNVSTIEELLKSLMDGGAKLIACRMSMDVMGIHEEEIIDGVEFGGVGAYLGESEDANLNLFI